MDRDRPSWPRTSVPCHRTTSRRSRGERTAARSSCSSARGGARDRDDRRLPDSVESLVAGDIDRLGPTDPRCSATRRCSAPAWTGSLLVEARDEVEARRAHPGPRLPGFVVPDPSGGVRFRNVLFRDGAYEGLAFRRRRELHRRVARRSSDAAERRGRGLGARAPFLTGAAIGQAWGLRLAGDRALSSSANVEAGRFYELGAPHGWTAPPRRPPVRARDDPRAPRRRPLAPRRIPEGRQRRSAPHAACSVAGHPKPVESPSRSVGSRASSGCSPGTQPHVARRARAGRRSRSRSSRAPCESSRQLRRDQVLAEPDQRKHSMVLAGRARSSSRPGPCAAGDRVSDPRSRAS